MQFSHRILEGNLETFYHTRWAIWRNIVHGATPIMPNAGLYYARSFSVSTSPFSHNAIFLLIAFFAVNPCSLIYLITMACFNLFDKCIFYKFIWNDIFYWLLLIKPTHCFDVTLDISQKLIHNTTHSWPTYLYTYIKCKST